MIPWQHHFELVVAGSLGAATMIAIISVILRLYST